MSTLVSSPLNTCYDIDRSLGGEICWRKGPDTALTIFREARVVERAIQKTNERFTPADHRHTSNSIRPYLDEWIQSPAFERIFDRFAEDEEIDENHLLEQFDLPYWWSEELEQALREWTSVPENEAEQMVREARESGLKSRLGLGVKHTPQEPAGALLWKADKGELPDALRS